jgi:acyl carrier protein
VAFVRQSIAHVLRLRDWQSLKRNQPLLDLGFDSLMAVELRNVLRQGLALPRKLPATLLFDHPSIAAIAAYLEKMLDEGAPAAVAVASLEPAGAAAESTGMDDLALLSDAEVEALLLKKLTQL